MVSSPFYLAVTFLQIDFVILKGSVWVRVSSLMIHSTGQDCLWSMMMQFPASVQQLFNICWHPKGYISLKEKRRTDICGILSVSLFCDCVQPLIWYNQWRLGMLQTIAWNKYMAFESLQGGGSYSCSLADLCGMGKSSVFAFQRQGFLCVSWVEFWLCIYKLLKYLVIAQSQSSYFPITCIL